MKLFLAFITKEFKHILRDTRTLIILFGMPIVQIILFGFALTNEVKDSRIGILDYSKDQASQQIIQELDASRYFDVEANFSNPKQIDQAFKEGKIRLAVVFPANFRHSLFQQNTASIQLIADASDPNTASTVVNYASAILKSYQDEILGEQTLPYTIQPEIRMLYNPQLKGAYNFVPGVMAMILLLISAMMTSIAIVREKELGTMEVLLVSPVPPILVIVTKAIPYVLLSFINVSTILILSVNLLDVPIQGSLLLLLGESMLFIFAALALGLFISTITNSQQVAMLASLMVLLLPTLIFSGFMFPIENMPKPMQFISNLIPSKWYFFIVRDVMIKGLGFKSVLKESLILVAMTIGFVLIALKNYKTRLE
ncbi:MULTISPECIES: ABC transporter permease [Flectobacillus]|uniref:Transport permease protein n=1 Tax=Flectobacillus roseus TaxID=502259 RepID=A0ABT6Y4R9_9BACT|nr:MULTISPECIES: ABC transporter permease [Flectobacillus]MDI9858526.1 ABC transporter permease [Flectobacillus roseus]MDI9870340.1 ABC transporter permease [Flectobacillus roseus]PAC28593.1 multidrug ABC transporter permease [Flectobacillus sp. BAB-3569]